jgi:hypothetical protein
MLLMSFNTKGKDTVKGPRISVHVYTNDRQTAINKAIETYLETKLKAEGKDISCTNGNYR